MGTTRQKSSCRNRLQNGPRSLSRAKVGYTFAFANRITHSGLHGETGGVLGGGGITTLGAFHTFWKPCVAGYQNGKLCRFCALIRCASEERGEPAGQRCVHARRCPVGVAAPLGCVILFLLSKLRLVCPALRAFPCVRGEGWYHYPQRALRAAETPDGRVSKGLICRFLRLPSSTPCAVTFSANMQISLSAISVANTFALWYDKSQIRIFRR